MIHPWHWMTLNMTFSWQTSGKHIYSSSSDGIIKIHELREHDELHLIYESECVRTGSGLVLPQRHIHCLATAGDMVYYGDDAMNVKALNWKTGRKYSSAGPSQISRNINMWSNAEHWKVTLGTNDNPWHDRGRCACFWGCCIIFSLCAIQNNRAKIRRKQANSEWLGFTLLLSVLPRDHHCHRKVFFIGRHCPQAD